MKIAVFKTIIFLLFFAGSFSSCWHEETVIENEEISPCDPNFLENLYQDGLGIPPWIDEVIFEWLENGICGSINRCDYRDGRGFLFEQFENNTDDLEYSFCTCDGTVLYDGEKIPMEVVNMTFDNDIQTWLDICKTKIPETNHRVREYISQYQMLCKTL